MLAKNTLPPGPWVYEKSKNDNLWNIYVKNGGLIAKTYSEAVAKFVCYAREIAEDADTALKSGGGETTPLLEQLARLFENAAVCEAEPNTDIFLSKLKKVKLVVIENHDE